MAKLVSKVYGDALLEAAMENNKVDEIYQEVELLYSIFSENQELQKILESPKIVREDKIETMKAIFSGKVSDEVMGFLITVVDKGRQGSFDSIFEYFIAEYKEYKNIGIVYVVSAFELSEQQKKMIEEKILATTNYVSVEMKFDVDAELIGGMTIRINDRVIDSSIKTKIYELKKDLLTIQLA